MFNLDGPRTRPPLTPRSRSWVTSRPTCAPNCACCRTRCPRSIVSCRPPSRSTSRCASHCAAGQCTRGTFGSTDRLRVSMRDRLRDSPTPSTSATSSSPSRASRLTFRASRCPPPPRWGPRTPRLWVRAVEAVHPLGDDASAVGDDCVAGPPDRFRGLDAAAGKFECTGLGAGHVRHIQWALPRTAFFTVLRDPPRTKCVCCGVAKCTSGLASCAEHPLLSVPWA